MFEMLLVSACLGADAVGIGQLLRDGERERTVVVHLDDLLDDDRPVVHVYAPAFCVPCGPMVAAIGRGDDRVRVNVLRDFEGYPDFIKSFSRSPRAGGQDQNGFPVIHYKDPRDNRWKLRAGKMTLGEIAALVSPDAVSLSLFR